MKYCIATLLIVFPLMGCGENTNHKSYNYSADLLPRHAYKPSDRRMIDELEKINRDNNEQNAKIIRDWKKKNSH